MNIKILRSSTRLWFFYGLVSLAIVYLGLIWKTTADLDHLITESLFWGVIIYLLWQKRTNLQHSNQLLSTFFSISLITVTLYGIVNLAEFNNELIFLFPFVSVLGILLLTLEFQKLCLCWRELIFSLVLFIPNQYFDLLLESTIKITVLTAKISTYLLYYLGFNVANQGDEVILFSPDSGKFTAIVNLPCTGSSMMLLMLKLALLLVIFFQISKIKKISLILISLGIGFISGVIRVSFLTLTIPNPERFNYWHGAEGSQIISTLAVIIFSSFCYWMLPQQNHKTLFR